MKLFTKAAMIIIERAEKCNDFTSLLRSRVSLCSGIWCGMCPSRRVLCGSQKSYLVAKAYLRYEGDDDSWGPIAYRRIVNER